MAVQFPVVVITKSIVVDDTLTFTSDNNEVTCASTIPYVVPSASEPL